MFIPCYYRLCDAAGHVAVDGFQLTPASGQAGGASSQPVDPVTGRPIGSAAASLGSAEESDLVKIGDVLLGVGTWVHARAGL